MRRLVLVASLLVGLAGVMSACENATLPGAMQLIVGGLPAGFDADVTVSGPNGFSRQPSSDLLLQDLEAGSYQVTARSVSSGGDTFRPEPSSQSVVVRSGDTTSVQIAYADASLTTGSIEITIGGLPIGSAAPVTLRGPEGFVQSVAASGTIGGLEPGTYTVTALELETAGDIFAPDSSSQSVAVVAGGKVSVQLTYQQLGIASGEMEVIIVGLPVEGLASVTVSNALGFSQTIAATGTLLGLTPGEYLVSATELSADPYTFAPSQASQTVTVDSGELARVTVRYVAVTSALTLTIEGLPSGAAAAVTFEPVDGSVAIPELITESVTLTDLPPGDYLISAAGIAFDGFRFEPDRPSVTIEAIAGETTVVSMAYRPVDGKLLVTEEGLPGNDSVDLGNLAGPGLESGTKLATDTFLDGLDPGSYGVSERLVSIVVNDVTYLVDGVPTSIDVLPGQITVVAVRFLAQQGDLAIQISGLPVGFDANVVVTGGGGFSVGVKTSTTLFALEPGNYTISASDVPDEGRDYQPSPTTQIVTVLKGRTVKATVTYAKPQVVCC